MRTLKTIRALSLLADNIEYRVDELSALRVVTLRPVVTSSALTEDEVVGTEEVAEGARADGVHGTGLQINEDCTGHVLVRADFVVVHVDPLELKVVVALVQSIRLNAVLIRDDLPELGTCDEMSDRKWISGAINASHQSGYHTRERNTLSDVADIKRRVVLTWPVWR